MSLMTTLIVVEYIYLAINDNRKFLQIVTQQTCCDVTDILNEPKHRSRGTIEGDKKLCKPKSVPCTMSNNFGRFYLPSLESYSYLIPNFNLNSTLYVIDDCQDFKNNMTLLALNRQQTLFG